MTDTIRVRYNQRQAKNALILGVVFLALGLTAMAFGFSQVYFLVGMGSFYIGTYFYKRKRFYLVLKDGVLKKDFGATIAIEDVIQTRTFAGDFIFKSKDKEMVLDRNLIDKESIVTVEKLIATIRDRQT